MKSFTSVDEFIEAQDEWQDGLKILREIVLDTELEEKVKWGAPCYTLNNKNVVGLGSFKSYFGLWFHQGVFMDDPKGVLINAQEGKTKALRQWRFSSIDEVDRNLVSAYVLEAIQNQKAGKEVAVAKPSREVEIPDELAAALAADARLQEAFEVFTPGRQREFAEYITSAKREATRLSRLEKIKPMILDGVGLNDKYRK